MQVIPVIGQFYINSKYFKLKGFSYLGGRSFLSLSKISEKESPATPLNTSAFENPCAVAPQTLPPLTTLRIQ